MRKYLRKAKRTTNNNNNNQQQIMKDIITRSFRMVTRNIINFNCSVAYKINVMMDTFDLNGSKSFELAGYPAASNIPDSRTIDFEAILNEIFLFAAPKKKVS